MSPPSTKPIIFISYSHKDEPDRAPEGDIYWLAEIQKYLAPATKGVFRLWTDEDMAGGADWKKEIKDKLADCDICILLVSPHSLASEYVIDVEIETILERRRNGHDAQIYPIALSSIPQTAVPASLSALNIRPRLDKPLSGFTRHECGVEISKIADEIVGLLSKKAAAGGTPTVPPPKPQPAYVHIGGLPETAYERLVGRDAELKRLDEAWTDSRTNILSLVAEGGAGKSALVNEWLKRLQADDYRGADTVLGWSFYSQGTKERATSADAFLDWALDKFGVEVKTTSAAAKGEGIAEAMMQRRTLLVLDGVEPLQHGLDAQLGQLKDQGLRALLRRFAATPPAEARGLIVLTSRLAVKDIGHWRNNAASVVDVEKLSDEAGAALLRDNGVWGTDKELRAASHDFGGHPLALGLLASFLNETQTGDARRRDHIRALIADPDNPGHDHAVRVMESYEKDWLAGQPVLLAILRMVGLFDRPASGDCLGALRTKPTIEGLTDAIVDIDDGEWQRAVARLREARLLAPPDPTAPGALDAHPLVREWFGERLRQTNEVAWKAAHGRLYDHLRDATKEAPTPTLANLAPLYQAIAHGCRAGRHEEALTKIYWDRICRRYPNGELQFYTTNALGASASDLAAISSFFDKPYQTPAATLDATKRAWVLSDAGFGLRAQGRSDEALPAMREALRMEIEKSDWRNAPIQAGNLSEAELVVGKVAAAVATAEQSVTLADLSRNKFQMLVNRATHAHALHAAGQCEKAELLFAEVLIPLSQVAPWMVRARRLERRQAWVRLVARNHRQSCLWAPVAAAVGFRTPKKRDRVAWDNGISHFADTEQRQRELNPKHPFLFSLRGYQYCDLLLSKGDNTAARDRAAQTLEWAKSYKRLLDIALDTLILGRANFALAIDNAGGGPPDAAVRNGARVAGGSISQAVEGLRASGHNDHLPRGLLARAAFRRSVGDWKSTARDLDEVEEIAEPGPMRLFLCDLALERARLAFARLEAFAPLNGLVDDSPPKPALPDAAEAARLREEAAANLATARKLIADCGYHRRDEEQAELEDVAAGRRPSPTCRRGFEAPAATASGGSHRNSHTPATSIFWNFVPR